MKKRAMKKWIPKNTMYCYKIIRRNSDGSFKIIPCPWFKYLRTVQDSIAQKQTNGDIKLVPTKRRVYICRYTGITTEEDCCLYDDCKVCGVKEPKF